MGKKMIQNFLRNEKGNIALMFSVCIMAIFAVVGVSVDYARLINEKQSAQNILDASVLAAATEYQRSGNKRKARKLGIKHMTSSWPGAKKKQLKINVTNSTLTGTYEDEMDNTFMSIFATPTSSWSVKSKIEYSRRATTDFALAVDVSNSMITHNLMGGLRRSLANFSRKAFNNTSSGDVSVSLVPFANAVSFEPNYNRWLDRSNGLSQTNFFNGCFEYTPISNQNLLSKAGNSNRIAAFDRRRDPNGDNTPFCPETNSNVALYLDNEADLSTRVSNLTTGQGTNTADGLTWAWRALAPEWQDTINESTKYPRPYSATNNKVLILLTDGKPYALPSVQNAQTDTDQARKNALIEFKNICKQISDNGKIDLYTIVYGNIMNEAQRKAIRKCVAGNGRSFWGGNANQLSSIFTRIVSMNSELALSR